MFKKIAIVAALATSASFASWDMYPVLEQHKGEVSVGVNYSTDENTKELSVPVGARFSVIQNLELAFMLPYRIFTHDKNGNDIKRDGFEELAFMVRYQITPTTNAFADVRTPIGDGSDYEKKTWIAAAGAQYSNSINPFIRFGSEIGLTTYFVRKMNLTTFSLNASTEFEFKVTPQFTPYVGANLGVLLGSITEDGYRFNSAGDGHVDARIYVGAKYAFNDMFEVGVNAGIWFGNCFYKDNTEKSIGTYGRFKF